MRYICKFSLLLIFLVSIQEASADLLASYPLDGTAEDVSGAERNGTVVGATATADRFGREGRALAFDGDDFIQTPVDSNRKPLSFSVWFRADQVDGERSIVDSDINSAFGHSLIIGYALAGSLGDGTLDVQFHNGAVDGGFTVTAGQWTHAVVVYADDELRLYANNFGDSFAAAPVLTSPYDGDVFDGSAFRLGRHNLGDPQFFVGAMDDVRFFDHALSVEEIQVLFQGSALPALLLQPPQSVFQELSGTTTRVTTGDFDDDGRLDAVVLGNESNTFAVFPGDGAGGFLAPPGPLPTVRFPVDVETSDFDVDGNDDLAILSEFGELAVMLGDGEGSFQALTVVTVVEGAQLSDLEVGDLDSDGVPDLVTVDSTGKGHVLLGRGDGRFDAIPDAQEGFGGPASLHKLQLADLTGDDVLDLAVVAPSNDLLFVLTGMGNGRFQALASSPFATGSRPEDVGVADIDGDGDLDLVVVNSRSLDLTLFSNAGDGGFGESVTSAVIPGQPSQPTDVRPADFDGDGNVDLMLESTFNLTSLLRGDGAGGFGVPEPIGTRSTTFTVADLNRDTRPDLVLVETPDSLVARLGPAFEEIAAPPIPLGRNPIFLSAGSFDDDPHTDLVFAVSSPRQLILVNGVGNGQFMQRAPAVPVLSEGLRTIGTADIDVDGHLDLALGISNDLSRIEFLRGDGAGGFIAADPALELAGSLFTLGFGDLGGNSGVDIAVMTDLGVFVALGDGGGAFTITQASPVGPELPFFGDFALDDFNGDGNMDLAIGASFPGEVSVLLGDGTGAFVEVDGSPFEAGLIGINALLSADMNGNGDQDLVLGRRGGQVEVLLGAGDGSFSTVPNGRVFSPLGGLLGAVVDVTGDGNLDAVVAQISGQGELLFFRGNGTGGFHLTPVHIEVVGARDLEVVGADLDGDGRLDLATLARVGEKLSVLTSDVIFGAGSFERRLLLKP